MVADESPKLMKEIEGVRFLPGPPLVLCDPVGETVKPPSLQVGNCEFESRRDHHFYLRAKVL